MTPFKKTATVLLAGTVWLTGCGGDEPGAQPVASNAESTAITTSIPTPSSTEPEAPQMETAKEYADALRAIVDTMSVTAVYTAKTDPNDLLGRPGGYMSKVNFEDSRVPKDELIGLDKDDSNRGGSIEVYEDAEAASKRAAYIKTVTENVGFLTKEYHWMNQGVLLRVTGELTPKQARAYKQALEQVSR